MHTGTWFVSSMMFGVFKLSNLSTSEDSLYWACLLGYKELVLKVANQKNVHYVYPLLGETPLHQACKWPGWLDIVKLFIEKYGCDPSVKTKSNQSLLHYACQYGNIDMIQYFVNKQHLNPLLKDKINQFEPLDYAINGGLTQTAVYLCQHCISSDEMLNPSRIKTTINLIKHVVFTADIWQLQYPARNKDPVDPKWKTANGDRILQLIGSSKSCISRIPSALVLDIINSHNVNCIFVFKPDLRTADDDTILQLVCQSERTMSRFSARVLVKLFKESRNIPHNAVHLACKAGKFAIVEHLLSVGRHDPNVKSKNEELPIQLTSDLKIMKTLVEYGAQMTTDVVFKLISKHYTDSRVCELLTLSKMKEIMLWNPHDVNNDGYTALHLTCKVDSHTIVNFFTLCRSM